jgi:putative transposase
MDFFAVPTLTFRVLPGFFGSERGRRKILHFNISENPTSPGIVQQRSGAFPESCLFRYGILNGDVKQ